MVTPAAERKAVAHLVDAHGMSERRACKAIGCCRMTTRYRTTRADDAGVRQRMKGDCPRTPPLRLSATACFAQTGRLRDQPQEAVPALPGGEACGAPTWRSQAGDRDQGANAGSNGTQRPLVPRLRVGSAHRRPSLPRPDRGRRLHTGMPGAGGPTPRSPAFAWRGSWTG